MKSEELDVITSLMARVEDIAEQARKAVQELSKVIEQCHGILDDYIEYMKKRGEE